VGNEKRILLREKREKGHVRERTGGKKLPRVWEEEGGFYHSEEQGRTGTARIRGGEPGGKNNLGRKPNQRGPKNISKRRRLELIGKLYYVTWEVNKPTEGKKKNNFQYERTGLQ